MLEAPSADQLERMMSLEPIAQVLHMYGHVCNRQMQLHHRDKYITNGSKSEQNDARRNAEKVCGERGINNY